MIADHSDADANIIFGAVIDDDLGDEMKVTVIASGFDRERRGAGSVAPGFGPPPSSDSEGGDLDIPGFVQG